MHHDIISTDNTLVFIGTQKTTAAMLKLLIDVYGGETTVCDMMYHITFVRECDVYNNDCKEREHSKFQIPKTKFQIPKTKYQIPKSP